MRLKRNVVTIIYSGIFVLIMLMGCLYLVTESYERFAADGMEWIFIILLVIACLLYIIGAYFLKEKAALKGIQTESSSLIVVEGILVVALIGLLFYTAMSTSVEAGIWMGVYLALVYGCSRVLGGRLCGLGGAVFGFLIVFFGLDSGWIAFSSDEMIAVMSLLAPFFVFLLMTKFIIPQFAKNNAIIVCSMLVLGALFGMAINLNVIAAFLCVGCVLSLIFGKLRSADTIPTKGPVLAGMCFGFSVIGTVGLSFLLEKDLGSVLSFPIESGFDNAVAGGETVTYALDKIHTMFAQVLLHSFDYGLLGIIILLFGIAAGLFTILRKLSGMGPMLLAFVGAVCYYIVGAEPGSHSYYVTFLAALFAAYGLYNSLLPEFLGKFMDDEDEEEKTSSKKSRLKGKVADENKRSGASDSDAVLGVSENVSSLKGPNSNDAPGVGVDMSGKEKVVEYTPTPEDTHFQEWHVSEEFIREDKLRKERQEERERSYALAKAQQAAREKGASEEELKAMAIASENEAKAKASGRVVFSGGSAPDAPGNVGAPAEADSISAGSVAQDNSVSVSDSDNSLQFEQSEPEGVASLEFTDAVTPDDSESKIEFIQQEPEDRSESTIDVMDTAGNYANGEFMDISGANLDESESKATEATYGQLGSDQDDNASETVAVETEAPEESAVTENAAPEIEASVVEAADEAGAANEDTSASGYEEEVKEDTGSSTVYSGYGGSSSAVDVKSVTGAYSEPLGVAATTAAALGSALSTAASGIVTGDILNHNETGADEDSGPDMSNLSAGSGYSEPELMSTYRPDSDTIIMSGYQNSMRSYLADDLLDAAAPAPVSVPDEAGPQADILAEAEAQPAAEAAADESFQPEAVQESVQPEATESADFQFEDAESIQDEAADSTDLQFEDTGSVQNETAESIDLQFEDTESVQAETLSVDNARDLLSAINETEVPKVEIPDVPEYTSDDSIELNDNSSASESAGMELSSEADKKLAAAAASLGSADLTQEATDAEKLDNLLDRLDVSDSIKRMNESAREDMADVIEQAEDDSEDEVVLVNEDYNFGGEDGEYGDVPTISDLEYKWKAEQQLNEVSDDQIPDVVTSVDELEDIPVRPSFDDFDFTENTDSKPHMMSFDDIVSAKPTPVDDTDETDVMDIDETMTEPVMSADTVTSAAEQDIMNIDAAPADNVTPVAGPEIRKFEPERIVLEKQDEKPIQSSLDDAKKAKDAENTKENDNFESLSFKEMAQKPTPTPVANHTDQSPVYTFTSRDVSIDVRADESKLGIPKPGEDAISSHVRRYAKGMRENGRPMAASLDEYERAKKDRPVHTEEVIARSSSGQRAYHRIILGGKDDQ